MASTIVYQHNAEKKGSREGGRYNRDVIGYLNGGFPNGKICLKITLRFLMAVLLGSRIGPTTVNKSSVTSFQRILTPLFITIDMFALVVPYFLVFDFS